MKKLLIITKRYFPTLIVFLIFVIAVNIVHSREYDSLLNIDLVKHVLLIGFLLLSLLILTHVSRFKSFKIKRYIYLSRINLRASLPFIIFFTFIITNDGLFPEFNFVIALFISYLIYCIFVFLHSLNIEFTNSYVNKYKIVLFNIIIFLMLVYLSNNSDDRGIYSTRLQFELLSFLFVFKIVIVWLFDKWKLIRQLKNEKVSAELMHLKNQINPHFFFNTLNNLYGLTREKSDKAPEMVLQLSDMMRYTIYQGKKDRVSLENEISYIENFIELNKMRYQKDVTIRFDKEMDQKKIQISPLLFINLVENAFKHGIEHLTSDAFVYITLRVKDNLLMFSVENNFDPDEISETKGIGIDNLLRRLELIYPKKHSLEINTIQHLYKVTLNIDLG